MSFPGQVQAGQVHPIIRPPFRRSRSVVILEHVFSGPHCLYEVRKLPSFSTPNYGKAKPTPLNHTSACNNTPSYVSISSTESTPLDASTSSIPTKRLSSGAEDIVPRISPKRPKIDHPSDKENIFHRSSSQVAKGKARAKDQPSLTSRAPIQPPLPALHIPSDHSPLPGNSTATLRAAFEALPYDADLSEVCPT